MLTVTEELCLLLFDDDEQRFVSIERNELDWLFACSTIVDLLLNNRVECIDNDVKAIDVTPFQDALLDPVLALFNKPNDVRSPLFLMKRIAQNADETRSAALECLVQKKVMRIDDAGVHTLSRWVRDTHRYPRSLAGQDMEVKTRIFELLLTKDEPAQRDVTIIALADTTHAFELLMSKDEYTEVKPRIKEIAAQNELAKPVVASMGSSIRAQAIRPVVKGIPLLGSAIGLSGDARQFLIERYLEHGPVFRVKVLNRIYTVMAGVEANNFVQRHGREFLRSKETWTDFDRQLNASRSMVSLDGREHYQLRKHFRDNYSRNTFARDMKGAIDIVLEQFDDVPIGKPQRVLYAMQQVISEQIGVLTTGVSPREYVDDLILFLETMLLLKVTKSRPGFEVVTLRVRRAQQRLVEFAKKVIELHMAKEHSTDHEDLVDACLAMHRSDPDLMPETDLILTSLGPFFAGLETAANASSFLLYSLFKHPNLMAAAKAEANDLFSDEVTASAVTEKLDVLQRTFKESMRLYPVTPIITRTVSNSFEFGGYRIPAGELLLLAISVPFALPEYFPEPEKFDIDRYLPERAEHRQSGVYVPFGVGTHRCLGADFAELMVLTNVATILHHYDIVLSPKKYELKMHQLPTPHPDSSFKFRLLRQRSNNAETVPATVAARI